MGQDLRAVDDWWTVVVLTQSPGGLKTSRGLDAVANREILAGVDGLATALNHPISVRPKVVPD
jgi:hypothetical protein